MGELTYDALRDYRRRLGRQETTIESEATHYTLVELASALRMTRGMLQAIAADWTQEQLLVRPPFDATVAAGSDEDRWSATEVITHLIATENWYLLHMGRLIGQRDHFDLMPRGLGDHARQDVPQDELAPDLAAATERLLRFIASIPPDADLTAQRDSTFFGNLSLRGWVLLAITHDLDHWTQIQRLTELPDFPRPLPQ